MSAIRRDHHDRDLRWDLPLEGRYTDPPPGKHPLPQRITIKGGIRDWHCDSCKQGMEPGVPAICMGSHSDTEYGPCFYCLPCIERASGLLIPEDVGP
jgi:hypothetical protein